MKLGTPVVYTATMTRHCSEHRDSMGRHDGDRRVWQRSDHEPRHGILAGYRTVFSGVAEYLGEEGTGWQHEAHHRVALVYIDLYRNPVRVPVDAIQEAP